MYNYHFHFNDAIPAFLLTKRNIEQVKKTIKEKSIKGYMIVTISNYYEANPSIIDKQVSRALNSL